MAIQRGEIVTSSLDIMWVLKPTSLNFCYFKDNLMSIILNASYDIYFLNLFNWSKTYKNAIRIFSFSLTTTKLASFNIVDVLLHDYKDSIHYTILCKLIAGY